MGFIRAKTSQLAITRAYVLALVVIAGLASAGMGTTLLLLHVEEQSSVEINVAGRQRMLSQRIGMFVGELASMRQPEVQSGLRERLAACIDLFERAHHQLLVMDHGGLQATAGEGIDCRRGLSPRPPTAAWSEETSVAFVAGDPSLDDRVTEFIRLARAIASDPGLDRAQVDALLAAAQDGMPQAIDRFVNLLQLQAEQGVERTRLVTIAIWAATLLLLILQGLFTFRPLRRRVDGAVSSLEDTIDTLRLREAELLRAKNAAEAANRTKSQFLSSMSHELRTPLNGIIGSADLLKSDPVAPLNDDQRKLVSLIFRSGEHLLTLIDEILDFAGLQAGTLRLSMEPVDPALHLSECVAVADTIADKHGVRLIDQTADQTLPHIWSDAVRFKQVVLNLISNAVKYNLPGGTVTVQAAVRNGDRLRVTVSDTGRGISAEDYDKIFEPFQRLGLESLSIEGTGIGLSICKDLVERMNGSIGFSSVVGEGSAFWFELPVVEGLKPVTSTLRPTAMPETGAAPVPPAGGGTVLYIEDNPDNILLMREVISRLPGFRLLSAREAATGLQLALTVRPDVVLLDINLPGIDGYQALDALRSAPAVRDTPVIAITASARPDDIDRGLAAGFDAYLTKPLDAQKLLATLAALLQQDEEEEPA